MRNEIEAAAKVYKALMSKGYTDIHKIAACIYNITNGEVRIKVISDGSDTRRRGLLLLVYNKSVKEFVNKDYSEKRKCKDYNKKTYHMEYMRGVPTNWARVAEDLVMATYRVCGGTGSNTPDFMEYLDTAKVLLPRYYVVSVNGEGISIGNTGVFLANTAYWAMVKYCNEFLKTGFEESLGVMKVITSYSKPTTADKWIRTQGRNMEALANI